MLGRASLPPGRWIFGYGLKKHYPWLQTDYLDYALPSPLANLHSIVFWALYHGGVVGLLLLCSLLISAFFAALRAAACSASPFALCWLIYGSSCAVFTGSSFIYRPAPEWLIFWGPVCYVITASLVSNDSLPDEE